MSTKLEYESFKWGDYSIVWVDSRDIDGALEFYREKGLDGIGVSPHHGYKNKDLAFLDNVKDLSGLVIVYGYDFDISPVERCQGLRFLVISENKQGLDLSQLPALCDLSLDWNKRLILPRAEDSPQLSRLHLWGFLAGNLESLSAYPQLAELHLIQATVQTLDGIGELGRLTDLELAYCSRLRQLRAIAALKSLRTLDIENCKRIQDWSVLQHCAALTLLRLEDCGDIEGISFIKDMPSLQEFRFVTTNIVDGDLSPCLGLKTVAFLPNKKHYSHTLDQIEAALRAKQEQEGTV